MTAGGRTYPLDLPFFVLATQNPIEQEGTYPLPEAQLDRFMFNIEIRYPDFDDEVQIVTQTTSNQNRRRKKSWMARPFCATRNWCAKCRSPTS